MRGRPAAARPQPGVRPAKARRGPSPVNRQRSPPAYRPAGRRAGRFLNPFAGCTLCRYDLKPMDQVLAHVVGYLGRSPWWARFPERHLFFFMSGVGAGIVPSWQQLIGPAVFVVAEGDRQADYFREGHDIIVPGKIGVRPSAQQVAGSQRKLMGVFRGVARMLGW